jgi:hypothetical protein
MTYTQCGSNFSNYQTYNKSSVDSHHTTRTESNHHTRTKSFQDSEGCGDKTLRRCENNLQNVIGNLLGNIGNEHSAHHESRTEGHTSHHSRYDNDSEGCGKSRPTNQHCGDSDNTATTKPSQDDTTVSGDDVSTDSNTVSTDSNTTETTTDISTKPDNNGQTISEAVLNELNNTSST